MSGRHRQPRTRGRHRQPPQRARLVVPSLAAVAVLGVGGVSAAAALSGGGSAAPVRMPRVVSGILVPGLVQPSAPPQGAAPRRQPVHVRPRVPDFALTVVGRVSWVEVDGPHRQVLFAGMLRHGRSLSFAQRPLWVTIGDAGAVRVALHHRVHVRAGRPGQVARFHVNVSGR